MKQTEKKMAATASMMPIFGQQISSKNDLVPDWSREEVSTGVGTGPVGPERTGFGSVRFWFERVWGQKVSE